MGATPNSTDFILSLNANPVAKVNPGNKTRVVDKAPSESAKRFHEVLRDRSEHPNKTTGRASQVAEKSEKKGVQEKDNPSSANHSSEVKSSANEARKNDDRSENANSERQNNLADRDVKAAAENKSYDATEEHGDAHSAPHQANTDDDTPRGIFQPEGNSLPQQRQDLPASLSIPAMHDSLSELELDALNAIQELTPQQLGALEALVEGGVSLAEAIAQILQPIGENTNLSTTSTVANEPQTHIPVETVDSVFENGNSQTRAKDLASERAVNDLVHAEVGPKKPGVETIGNTIAMPNSGRPHLMSTGQGASDLISTTAQSPENSRVAEVVPTAATLSEALRNNMKQDIGSVDLLGKSQAVDGKSSLADNGSTMAMTIKPLAADGKWGQTLQTLHQVGGVEDGVGPSVKLPVLASNREWGQAMADKMFWLASQKVQSAEVRLDPPELGPLQVKIAVNQDTASISFVSHNASVRDMLDQNAFRLREMFEQGGLNLVDVDVSGRDSGHEAQDDNTDGGITSGMPGEGDSVNSSDEPATLELLNLVDYYV
ncbi:flagellar hook-length control protein FliK [Aurantivibrio plasticivorans]